MKPGFQDRWKVGLMIALLFVAGFFLLRNLAGPATPATRPAAQRAEAGQRVTPVRRAATRRAAPQVATVASLDPTLRTDLLGQVEGIEYQGRGRNIFQFHRAEPPRQVEIPTPVAPPVVQPPAETGPPAPPPINLRFYGFASRPGEPRRVFLHSGEDIFVASEGDVVNRRYRIVRIGTNSIEVEDLQSNHRQTIPLTQS